MKNPPKGRNQRAPRFSPLYTSKDRELIKRQIVARHGADTDGATRATNRRDQKDTPASE